MALLTIDAGACTGWAFSVHDEITAAGVWGEWPGDFAIGLFPGAASSIVIEAPAAVWRSTTEDIIKLARRVGRWEQWGRSLGAEVRVVSPNDWKGSLPKGIAHRRILTALTPDEHLNLPVLPKSKAHNMLDAVGMNLWLLGRFK